MAEYHGPTLGVGKGRVWEQPADWVDSLKTPRDGSTDAAAASAATPRTPRGGLWAGQGSSEEEAAAAERRSTSNEEIAARCIDVSGLDESGAARAWVSAVLSEELDEAKSLQEVLASGVLLCRLVNAISPGVIHRVNEADRPWAHMENINNYTTACERLGVEPTFMTPDLYESKNLKVVVQNIHALARAAREHAVQFTGPLLAPQTERMQL